MFHIAETQLADEIKLDVMAMTPIEALQTLFELQKKAKVIAPRKVYAENPTVGCKNHQ